MELADIGEPRKLAAAVINQITDMSLPVPIVEIAYALNIVEIQDVVTDGFEGGLITNNLKTSGSILVNERSNPRRRRYTVGHEIGHYLNPWHKPKDGQQFLCSNKDLLRSASKTMTSFEKMEVEANQFAAELLMPTRIFRDDLRRLQGIDLGHIERLADKYDVSKEAAARRYVELQDEPCAIIFSHNGKIRYTTRNPAFPFLKCGPGEQVRGPLLANAETGRGSLVSNWIVVDGSDWVSGDRGRPMVEQTLVQQDNYQMALIAFEDEVDEEEEDDMEESWTARFKR